MRTYYTSPKTLARFWAKVSVAGEDECWLWTGSVAAAGYGDFKLQGSRQNIGSHRMAYIIANGGIPVGLLVRHRCDNPICVNPRHLELGTHADNCRDKMERGRFRSGDHSGENNPAAKLTATQVDEIRKLIAAGWFNTKIAPLFGVSHGLISRIRKGRSWAERNPTQ